MLRSHILWSCHGMQVVHLQSSSNSSCYLQSDFTFYPVQKETRSKTPTHQVHICQIDKPVVSFTPTGYLTLCSWWKHTSGHKWPLVLESWSRHVPEASCRSLGAKRCFCFLSFFTMEHTYLCRLHLWPRKLVTKSIKCQLNWQYHELGGNSAVWSVTAQKEVSPQTGNPVKSCPVDICDVSGVNIDVTSVWAPHVLCIFQYDILPGVTLMGIM